MSNRSTRYSRQFKQDAVAYARDHSDLSANRGSQPRSGPQHLGQIDKKGRRR